MKVAIIGAGPAGLCCLRHLKDVLDIENLVCFESKDQVGGIWNCQQTRLDVNQNQVSRHSYLNKEIRSEARNPSNINSLKIFLRNFLA